MSERLSDLEFDARIDREGRIGVPASAREALKGEHGHYLRVRLMPRSTSRALKAMGVTYEEIETIAAAQLESPERVEAFLLAEGVLARRKRRVGGGPGKRS